MKVLVFERADVAGGNLRYVDRLRVCPLDLPVLNIIIDIMKRAKKPSARGSISTHEMRFQFDRVLQAAKAGRSLTLTYRGKPLARIVPLKAHAGISPDDPVFRLHELAEPLGPLTNDEIDSAIYGQ